MPEIFLAFLLDLGVGDPVYVWHPARLIGKMIEKAEPFLRNRIYSPKQAGAVLAFALPALVWMLTAAMILSLSFIHPMLGWLFNFFGIYSALSIKDLHQEGMRIYFDLKKFDLETARKSLSRIVGRETQNLDEREVIRAGVETVAESTVDGIIAPLFFAALGGAPLALAYKAVNTLDSMIGHTNERYREFGFFAAKQDELWNWIPARLSYYLIGLASLFTGGQTRKAFAWGWKDGMNHTQGNGNSVIPEAAFAGSLGLKLGGPSIYEGCVKEKPFLGNSEKEFDQEDLIKSLKLMMMVSWLSLIGAMTFCFIIQRSGLKVF